MSKLVIVESPAKAKTIKKYLGSNYEVEASMGHLRDLPKSKIGIDFDNDFEPTYVENKDRADLIKKLRDKAAKSDYVYLATDPDREGEAISWHLANMLALDLDEENRVTFNEITKSGVKKGMEAPRKVDIDLVNAQQARRLLDRIVGYKLSPFLWKKVKRGLSAGRVQSVGVRLIVDRELEIRAFKAEEYWTIDAKHTTKTSDKIFPSAYYALDGEKKQKLSDEQETLLILNAVKNAEFIIKEVKKGTRKRQPYPPFITSSLQQDASRKYGFSGQRTMKIAQELYEGVNVLDLGNTGLITYMRTDSLRISDEARAIANEYISERFGAEYLPETPRVYKSKANSQDGHEAIRPSMPKLSPDEIKNDLSLDQFKIYKLIWDRFISSLMENCVLDTVKCDIDATGYIFKASGYSVKFDGFTRVYEETKEEQEADMAALPSLNEGETLNTLEVMPTQHFTQPPPRYTEATLIKALEEKGIGRPSTYAPTISTIIARNYVERERRTLLPTPLGEATNELMIDHFANIVDTDFTANMENSLDDVENGKLEWRKTLENFYEPFNKTLENAETALEGKRIKIIDKESDIKCDLCGKMMVIKIGRFGKFLACPGYPECSNTKPILKETPGICPKCEKRIVLRKSKNNKDYYACERGAECGFMTWDIPTEQTCPECGKTLFKQRGGVLRCLDENCNTEIIKKPAAKKTADTVKKSSSTKKTATKSTKSKTATKKATTKKPTATKKATTKKPTAKKTTTKKSSSTTKKSDEKSTEAGE